MSGFTGFIDPPSPFAGKPEWEKYLAELRKLEPSDQVREAIAEAEVGLSRAPEEGSPDDEDLDDISDLDDD